MSIVIVLAVPYNSIRGTAPSFDEQPGKQHALRVVGYEPVRLVAVARR